MQLGRDKLGGVDSSQMGRRDTMSIIDSEHVDLDGAKTESMNYTEQEQNEVVKPIKGLMARWAKGFDPVTRSPYPFECDIDEDFYDEEELETVISGKASDEVRAVIEENRKTIFRNNEEIGRLNDHILELSEMTLEERALLFEDERTSKSEQSLVACVEFWSMPAKQWSEVSSEDRELFDSILKATEFLYGFDVIMTRTLLKEKGSHFNILTKKEREAVGEGSLEDIASVALESFVMSPNFGENEWLVSDYDDYLYDIMLDCTRREVVSENGEKVIREEVDLEEFQARVIESMTPIFADEDIYRSYTPNEAKRIFNKVAPEMDADFDTGRHFPSDWEAQAHHIYISMPDGKVSEKDIFSGMTEEPELYWDTYERRIRKNNREVFRYNKELARLEMEPWAEKIDLDYLETINNDEDLDCKEKYRKITAYIQDVFGVFNFDDEGNSQPIGVKWCGDSGPFYRHSERSIYYTEPGKSKRKLTDVEVGTIVHEMWHARQEEKRDLFEKQKGGVDDAKLRMYEKNYLSYFDSEFFQFFPNSINYTQIVEMEAYTLDHLVTKRIKERYRRSTGKRLLSIL